MAAGSKFPLLQLPQKEILRTLRIMGIYQIIKFSLISKRCKQLVQSLQIKAEDLFVSIEEERIRIQVVTPTYYLELFFKNSNEDQRRRLSAPQWVEVDSRRLEQIGFEYSDWLRHFQDIFHFPSISEIDFDWGSFDYDLDEIKRVFGTTKGLDARNTGCYANNRMVLQKFLPVENLIISPDMFEDLKIPFNILQQNFATLEITRFVETPEITLNELLVMNSKRITIKGLRMSPKNLNMFIKLWMKGSNSRMEYLNISNGFRYDRAVVMKGIKTFNGRSEEMDFHHVHL